MRGALNLIAFFQLIFRLIRNKIKKSSLKKILKKLENNHDYRMEKIDEMDFTIGKIVDSCYDTVFENCKAKILNIKTDKFEVKGLFHINLNSFLVVVLCNDFDVSVSHNGHNQLSKYIRIFYFLIKKSSKDTKFEICTHIFEDLNQKNLLHDFYPIVIQSINKTVPDTGYYIPPEN